MPKRPLLGRTSGRHERGTPNSVEQLVGPRRRRRCRRASCGSRSTARWRARAGEVPQDPRVDGAERERRRRRRRRPRASSHSSLVAEKYGSSTSPVRARTSGSYAGGAQVVAARRGAAVLPHDGAVARPTGRAVPHHDRLALVGDADRRRRCRRRARRPPRRACRAPRARCRRRRARPSPAAGSAGGTPGRRTPPARAVGVDRDGAHAGRAGVDREHDGRPWTGQRSASASGAALVVPARAELEHVRCWSSAVAGEHLAAAGRCATRTRRRASRAGAWKTHARPRRRPRRRADVVGRRATCVGSGARRTVDDDSATTFVVPARPSGTAADRSARTLPTDAITLVPMRIGVLTGGGDCPGLNAVIRAVVRKGEGVLRPPDRRVPPRLARRRRRRDDRAHASPTPAG